VEFEIYKEKKARTLKIKKKLFRRKEEL